MANSVRPRLPDWRAEPRLVEIDALIRAGRLAEAIARSHAAAAEGLEHPMSLSLIAYGHSSEGRLSEAVAVVRRALELDPGEPSLLISLGNYLSAAGQMFAALEAYEAALRRAPGAVLALSGKARALFKLRDVAGAEALFRQILGFAPGHVDAVSGLALIAVQRGDFAEAKDLAARTLKLEPGHVEATMVLGEAANNEQRFEEAERHLRAAIGREGSPIIEQAALWGLLGDALHGQARYAEAFDAYQSGQRAFQSAAAALPAPSPVERETDRVARLLRYFEGADASAWRAPAVSAEQAARFPRHAFLVGFMRSGTTLLENIFAASPEVAALEEIGTLSRAIDVFFADAAGLDRLARLDAGGAVEALGSHAQRVRDVAGSVDGKLLLEKMPLYSMYAPAIVKLFPKAKLVFALRDPRDVVLSCLRRRILLGMRGAPEMMDLQLAAELYDGVMALFETYTRLFELEVAYIKNEDVVADFEGSVRKVFDFLGLEWAEEVRDFAVGARRRLIRTPSAHQVRRGLNASGVGQWRAYRDQLQPVLPKLAPWVERFGYPAD